MHRRQILQAGMAGAMLAPFYKLRAASASGRILRVGPQQALLSVAAAAHEARDGDTIEIEAGEYRADVAVWTQNDLTIRGVNGRARLKAAGASAEGKGIWVMRGGDIRVENVEFHGARVPHFNGSGIRLEQGRLHVVNSLFDDNEMGILTAGKAEIELRVEACDFSGPTEVLGDVPHNIYVGRIGRVDISACYFHHGRTGHLIKSRAKESFIRYNRVTDGSGLASYEMDFPNGGRVLAVGNIIQQSALTENPNMVAFGAEGYFWPENRLIMAHNTFINNAGANNAWVKTWPGNARARLWRNLYVGVGTLSLGTEVQDVENAKVDRDDLVEAARGDFRLKKKSGAAASLSPPNPSSGDEIPQREYVHPLQTRPLTPPKRWSPGALQTLGG